MKNVYKTNISSYNKIKSVSNRVIRVAVDFCCIAWCRYGIYSIGNVFIRIFLDGWILLKSKLIAGNILFTLSTTYPLETPIANDPARSGTQYERTALNNKQKLPQQKVKTKNLINDTTLINCFWKCCLLMANPTRSFP